MQSGKFTPDLIAPCGMNCGVCKAYLAYSRGVPKKRGSVTHCSGCLPRSKNCYIIRGCTKLSKSLVRFCFECENMPCSHLDRLDRRYRERYGMSMVNNLRELEENGVEAFLKSQEAKHKCPECGDVISVHDRKCYACGFVNSGPKKCREEWHRKIRRIRIPKGVEKLKRRGVRRVRGLLHWVEK